MRPPLGIFLVIFPLLFLLREGAAVRTCQEGKFLVCILSADHTIYLYVSLQDDILTGVDRWRTGTLLHLWAMCSIVKCIQVEVFG